MATIRPNSDTSDASYDRDAGLPKSPLSNWYVEILGKNGWQPLRGFTGGIAYFSHYEEAVARAVKEWERGDHPARPASAPPTTAR